MQTKKKDKTKTAQSKAFVLSQELQESLSKKGNLWYWTPTTHPWASTKVGFSPQKSHQEEFEEAKKERRTQSVLTKAKKFADKEVENKKQGKKENIFTGWSTMVPKAGTERNALAQKCPFAFLVFEETKKLNAQTGKQQIVHIPKFPIVSRAYFPLLFCRPDVRGVLAARNQIRRHLQKYGDTEIDATAKAIYLKNAPKQKQGKKQKKGSKKR